ncbi:DeoR/GlpR family DNA-binding transcription regulator [Acidipropionibacterium timonense]|uniref:DeoR/GlpR family DNA-binding transcription regulator n=1 Tax=Acidipropionibacterium timonense TaxID=2161818 RepID=UPI001031A6A1|nr:DeoR/GlpR family DNA-binding transcription regulator [Acidipropionibacterium timonense]
MSTKKPSAPVGPRARQLAIAQAVIRNGSASIDELVALTGVSAMTVYRDLTSLEDSGVLQRHRGLVVAVASGLHEADAEFRLEQSSAEKRAVAACAGQLIGAGSSIMLDDSTSAVWVLRSLPDLSAVTVVTNSLLVAREVTDVARSERLVVTGGEYQAWAHALMGPAAVRTIRSMHADTCIVSASGIFETGCYHPYQEVVEVKRAMLDSAESKVLLLDHTKFNRRALFKFADLQEFDHVIVDALTPATVITHLEGLGVQVTVATGEGENPNI